MLAQGYAEIIHVEADNMLYGNMLFRIILVINKMSIPWSIGYQRSLQWLFVSFILLLFDLVFVIVEVNSDLFRLLSISFLPAGNLSSILPQLRTGYPGVYVGMCVLCVWYSWTCSGFELLNW